MKYSKLFGKTKKNAKNFDSKNASLLIKAGFIDQTMAGVYTYLPLGLRVLFNIERIVREEMDTIGSEIFMPSLAPKKLWEQTTRFETIDVLFKVVGANKASVEKNDAEYVLNPTHEDIVTPLAEKFFKSYKDFPFAVYHIQTKFRNEPRAKSGLMRCREFRMKDLYSFHTSEEDLKAYYENAKKVYMRVFDRLGLGKDTMVALASGGDFTKDFSHEFQTRCDTGEDTVFYAKKADIAFNREIAPSKAPFVEVSEKTLFSKKDVEGKGIIGVEELAKFLKIPVAQTTKTLLFETDSEKIIAAAVRGGYDINEEKLKKIAGVKALWLARPEVVKQVTGAEVGYAGIINLPDTVSLYCDESMENRVNFETGANKTNFHTVNVNFGRDLPLPSTFYDIKTAKEGDQYPETGEVYEVFRSAEVGNIFPLNTKFTKAIGYTFTTKDGEQKPIYMGSYGIGTSRVMGVIVEKFSDEKGLVWPESVAPYRLHLISLSGGEEVAKSVYDRFVKLGKDVLWDDRPDVSAGEKFTDADLIGIPWRLVVSQKTGDKIEVKKRSASDIAMMSIEELTKQFKHVQ